VPVQITHPDLRVAIANAPANTTSGTTIGVDWTVTNNGTGVAQGNWVDRVYLSTNNTFEAGDILLSELTHTGPLANGSSYTAHRDVVIPIDKSGPFFLLVVTDAASQVFETTAGGAESNNLASSALNVTLAPYADLETYNVTVQNQVVGNPAIVTVGWSVRNALTGTGAGATATWTDAIIASTDTVIGNSDDRVLATYNHTGLLALGDSYNQSQTFYLPVDYQGRYHLFVKTDSAGVVFENAKEANNAAEAANVLDVLPVLYADLQVDSVIVPATGQSGTSNQLDSLESWDRYYERQLLVRSCLLVERSPRQHGRAGLWSPRPCRSVAGRRELHEIRGSHSAEYAQWTGLRRRANGGKQRRVRVSLQQQ
jgi:hypothetical protein